MRKLFRFPWDNSSEFGVNFSSLDKVLAHKTIERLDDSKAQDIAVARNCLGLDDMRSWAEFRSAQLGGLAQHSSQLVRGEQGVLCMFLIKDVVDSIASAS